MPAKFKAIIAPPVNVQAALAEFFDVISRAGDDPKKDLEATTATWSGAKPSFKKTIGREGRGIVLRVEAVGSAEGIQKWSMLDSGTRPHLIKPKNASRLAFQSGYQAKTVPGTFHSRSGGPFGETVFAKVVHHPGTAPRGWTELLIEKFRPKFFEACREAARRAAKRSGHGG